jgi:hypothetical protein
MKNTLCLTICALALLAFASTAQSKNARASGTFDFIFEGATGVIVFDVDGDDAGVHGQMSLNTTVDIGDPEGDGNTAFTHVAVEAQFDCLLVNDNQAAMSGVVTSANVPEYVGQQVILAVVEKVAGMRQPTDAFAWSVYKRKFVNPNATDYDFCPAYTSPTREDLGCDSEGPCELPPAPACNFDGSVIDGRDIPGAALTWTATDYELCPAPNEDNPNPPCESDPNAFTAGITKLPTATHCDDFALSAYPFKLIPRGHGNRVEVKLNP